MNKALFLDRDGVINVNHGYVHTIDKFDFIDGIFDLVRAANSAGYLVLVVTNQAGIARGFYSEEQFNDLTIWMCAEFKRHDASIDKVYYSPYHPSEGVDKYRRDDFTRKPHPGMLLMAKQEFSLSLSDSILVGDNLSDIEAGVAAGVGLNILFSTELSSGMVSDGYDIVRSLASIEAFLS